MIEAIGQNVEEDQIEVIEETTEVEVIVEVTEM
jgi:hypothetical protein